MRKTFTAATTCLSLLCSLPHDGICSTPDLAKEIVKNVENANPEGFLNQIAEIEKTIESADDQVAECRALLRCIVAEINAQYEVALTLPEICQMVRQNLDLIGIPVESRAEFLEALDLLEAEDLPQYERQVNAWKIFKQIKNKIDPEVVIITALCITGICVCYMCPVAAPGIMPSIGGAAKAYLQK